MKMKKNADKWKYRSWNIHYLTIFQFFKHITALVFAFSGVVLRACLLT